MYLDSLKIGEIAKIMSITDSLFREKLMDMGCVPGALIKPTFKAPFGDPIAFDLEGYTLSMRKAEARAIEVQKIGNDRTEAGA